MSSDTSSSSTGRVILPAPDLDWLALHQEPVLEPERAIIDPHHHLWDAPRPRYLRDDIERDLAAGHDVRATVFVECSEGYYSDGDEALRPVGETVFAEGVAAATGGRVCTGIVGYTDLRQGAAVKGVLEAHLEAGKGRFRAFASPASGTRTPISAPPAGCCRQACCWTRSCDAVSPSWRRWV